MLPPTAPIEKERAFFWPTASIERARGWRGSKASRRTGGWNCENVGVQGAGERWSPAEEGRAEIKDGVTEEGEEGSDVCRSTGV